jgi:hypothetical protein
MGHHVAWMHNLTRRACFALIAAFSMVIVGCSSTRPKPVAPSLTPISVQVGKAGNAVAQALPLVRDAARTGTAPGDVRLTAAGEQLQNAADALAQAEREVVGLQALVNAQAERLGKSEARVFKLESEKRDLLKIVWRWRLIALGVLISAVIYIFGPRLLSALKLF